MTEWRKLDVAALLFAVALGGVWLYLARTGPSSAELGALNNEAHKRDSLCQLAEAFVPTNPALEPLDLACDRRRPLSELVCLLPRLRLDTGGPSPDTCASSDHD